MAGQKVELHIWADSDCEGNLRGLIAHGTTWQDFTLLGVAPGTAPLHTSTDPSPD
jgi:hypothetical protein